jgi:hypothetical protein
LAAHKSQKRKPVLQQLEAKVEAVELVRRVASESRNLAADVRRTPMHYNLSVLFGISNTYL